MSILLLLLVSFVSSVSAGFNLRLRSEKTHRNFHLTALQRSAIKSLGEEKNEVDESSIILDTIMQSQAMAHNKSTNNKLTFLEWEAKAYPDPCKESDAKGTPFEIKSQGKDIAENDKLRKYTNPCKPPPFLQQKELQAPGLPAIPVPPALEMPR